MMKSIWKNFRFTRFFVAFTTGNLGDWFDIFALQLIFVREFHASPIVMGFLGLIYFLPGIFLSPFAGVSADRFSKRNLMIMTDAISAFLTIGLFFSTNLIIALALVLIRSALSSFNSPSQQGYIKQVVSEPLLLQASSYVAIAFQLCKMLGPLLGAVILIYLPARSCIVINAVSFILSAVILFTLPKDVNQKPIVENKINCSQKYSWLKDLTSGAQFVWLHRLIRNMMGLSVVWFFCAMIRNSQFAIFLNYLLPSEPKALGYVLGMDGLGALIAGSFLSRCQIKSYRSYITLGFFLMGLGVLGVAVYQDSWPRILLYLSPFVLGIGSGITGITYSYLLKKETSAHQIGCVYGIKSAVGNISSGLGTLLSGYFVIIFGVREIFLGIAVISFLLSISSIFLMRTTSRFKA